MNAERKFVVAVAALLAAAPLYAQVDLNQGSLKSFFKDSLTQTAVATPASAPTTTAAPAPTALQAKPLSRPIVDAFNGDRVDSIGLVSLRQLEDNEHDPVDCGWSSEGPMPCPTVFHPILKDGDAIGVEYSNCERNPGIEIPVDGCTSSVLFALPELKAKGDSITWNGEVVAKLKGRFLKGLKLVNGYRFAVSKTPAVETRGGDYTYEECIPVNPTESSEPCTKTGKIIHANDAHQVNIYQLVVSLTK
ncbi:MAG: hypothetical protein ACHQ2Z_05590 [Elusimicrobiota bacterium]